MEQRPTAANTAHHSPAEWSPHDGDRGRPLPLGSRRVGASDRSRALTMLQEALDDHRLDFREFDQARDQVMAATTANELRSALRPYVTPVDTGRRVVASAGRVGRTVALEGGRRLAASAVRGAVSFLLLLMAAVVALTGHPWLALAVFTASLGAGFLSIRALFLPRRRR